MKAHILCIEYDFIGCQKLTLMISYSKPNTCDYFTAKEMEKLVNLLRSHTLPFFLELLKNMYVFVDFR